MSRQSKYNFQNITKDQPAFYPWTSLEQHERIRRAAHQYNWRNRTTLRVKRGNREGSVGSWVTMSEVEKALTQELVQPKAGEITGSKLDKYGLGRVHYHGRAFIPMRHEPDSPEMRKALVGLNGAIDRYQRRHGIRIVTRPAIHEDQFGFWAEVEKDPELI